MKFGRKVVIAVSLGSDMTDLVKDVRGMDILNHSEVHLVTVIRTIEYAYGFGESSLVFPVADDRKTLEQSVLSTLVNMWEKIRPPAFEGKIVARCLFGENPKSRVCEYVEEQRADTILVATRKKRGLFESSFAQYVAKHSDANVIILKKHS